MWQLIKFTDDSSGQQYIMVAREGDAYRCVFKTKLKEVSFSLEVIVRDRNKGFLDELARTWGAEIITNSD